MTNPELATPGLTTSGLKTLLLGLGAGLAVFALDLLLAGLTLGYLLPVEPRYPVAYALTGGAIAIGLWLVGLALSLRRGAVSDPRAWSLLGGTVFLLYAPPVFERVEQAVRIRSGVLPAVIAATVALAVYALWALVLARLSERRTRGDREGARVSSVWLRPGLLLAALTVALGLAVNRGWVNRPTELRALVLDAAVLVVIVLLAVAVHRWGWRGTTAGLTALGALALALALTGGPFERRDLRPPGAARPAGSPSSGSRSPNLVLVIVDTLRQDVFRAVIDETEEGRRLHRALGDAVWFDHAVSAAPWTAPSVGSILTGLYPPEHGFGRSIADPNRPLLRLSRSVLTLAQFLSHRGYRTLAVVTNPLLYPASGIARGFDRYELLQSSTLKLPLLLVLVRAGLVRDELYQPARRARRHVERHLDEWIDPDRPFFLWLHLMDPHAPAHRHPDLTPDPAGKGLPPRNRLYRDETRYALRELAALLETLDRRPGFRRNTWLVMVGDHGEMFPSDHHFNGVILDGERKISGHGHAFYDELIRVPLVIRPPEGPGEPAGERRLSGLVSQVDLFANLVDALGLEAPKASAARLSFSRWLRTAAPAEPFEGREFTLSSANQYGAPHRALRTAARKLIHYPGHQRPDELYDLVADPGEHHDLAADRPDLVHAAIALEEQVWARLRTVEPTRPAEVDAETRRQLEALGYL